MRTAKEPKTVYKKLENRTLYIRSVISYYTINEQVFPALVLSSPTAHSIWIRNTEVNNIG